MQLWIRTKEGLFNVNGVRINAQSLMWEGKADIVSDTGFLLGTYKTRERALEIIEEIQKAITETSSLFCFTNFETIDKHILDLIEKNGGASVFLKIEDESPKLEIHDKSVIFYTMPEE